MHNYLVAMRVTNFSVKNKMSDLGRMKCGCGVLHRLFKAVQKRKNVKNSAVQYEPVLLTFVFGVRHSSWFSPPSFLSVKTC